MICCAGWRQLAELRPPASEFPIGIGADAFRQPGARLLLPAAESAKSLLNLGQFKLGLHHILLMGTAVGDSSHGLFPPGP